MDNTGGLKEKDSERKLLTEPLCGKNKHYKIA